MMCGSINISTISINIHESTIKQMGLKSWKIDDCPMRYPLTYPLYQLTVTESLSSYGYRSPRFNPYILLSGGVKFMLEDCCM